MYTVLYTLFAVHSVKYAVCTIFNTTMSLQVAADIYYAPCDRDRRAAAEGGATTLDSGMGRREETLADRRRLQRYAVAAFLQQTGSVRLVTQHSTHRLHVYRGI